MRSKDLTDIILSFSFQKMSHTTYKTTSNTLLLRRLISNLKERGSDVAGELEGRALDLLSDVQTRKKKTKVV